MIHLIARTHHMNEKHRRRCPFREIYDGEFRYYKSPCRRHEKRKIKRLLYVSSIKAVGEGSSVPYTEETPCIPQDFYGKSKRETEIFLHQCDFLT